MPTWTDPSGTEDEAFRFFVGVGRLRMRKAIILARRGQVHPDPDVAAAALRWAHMVLACGPAHPEFDSSRLRRYRALLGEMTWLSGSYAEWLRDRSLRRSAGLIIAAAESGRQDAAPGGAALHGVSRADRPFPREAAALVWTPAATVRRRGHRRRPRARGFRLGRDDQPGRESRRDFPDGVLREGGRRDPRFHQRQGGRRGVQSTERPMGPAVPLYEDRTVLRRGIRLH